MTASVTPINPHVGSSFQSFLEEEGIAAEVNERALLSLAAYAAAREQERYAHALAKTYHKRRQTAYTAFLREYQALQHSSSFTDEMRRYIDRKLDELNHLPKV